MGRKRLIAPETEAAIVSAYAAAARAGGVAAQFNFNRKTVTTIVRRNGGVVRGQQQASGRAKDHMGPFEDRIVSLRNAGLSQQQIAEQIGKSQPLVSRVDRTDNRLENLQLRQGRHGKGVVMRCDCCGSHKVSAVQLAVAD